MPPKSRGKNNEKSSSKKAKATKKTKKGKKTKKKHAKQTTKAVRHGKAPKARTAYQIYFAECRKEVMQRAGLTNKAEDFLEASRLLAQSWRGLSEEERATFTALAQMEKQKALLQGLKVRGKAEASSVAAVLNAALSVLGSAPAAAAPTGLAEQLVEAMEAVDSRLPATVRSVLPAELNGAENAKVLEHVKRCCGEGLCNRVGTVLQRWHGRALPGAPRSAPPRPGGTDAARAAQSVASPAAAPPAASKKAAAAAERVEDDMTVAQLVKRAPGGARRAPTKQRSAGTGRQPPAQSSLPIAGSAPTAVQQQGAALDDELRSKVVGVLMRTTAKMSGQAQFVLCRQIEEALFELHGKDPREYKRGARSLSFNLGSPDGALLRRVVAGEVQPGELVRLSPEELASDELKAERKEERERYFRNEVHDVSGPIKRRRDLFSSKRHGAGDDSRDRKEAKTTAGGKTNGTSAASAEDGSDDEIAEANAEGSSHSAVPAGVAEAPFSGDKRSSSSSGSSSSSDEGSTSSDSSSAEIIGIRGPPVAGGEVAQEDDLEGAALAQLQADFGTLTEEQVFGSPSSPSSPPPSAPGGTGQEKVDSSSEDDVRSPSHSNSEPSSPSGSPQRSAEEFRLALEHLVSMGFDGAEAEDALRRCKGNAESAVSMLCDSELLT